MVIEGVHRCGEEHHEKDGKGTAAKHERARSNPRAVVECQYRR